MAGHSKWANIKHRKGAQDALRAKLFAKLSKEIMVAANQGGPNPQTNSSLRLVISKAKANSMPKKNIANIIAKASGSKNAANFKEIIYGANVSNVAFLIVCLSDNPNRVAANIQSYFNRINGSIGSASSVGYIFDRKGVLKFQNNDKKEEEIMEIAIEANADDVKKINSNTFVVYTSVNNFMQVKEKFEENNIDNFEIAQILYIANNKVVLSEEKKIKMINFLEKLHNDEDIQDVYHNIENIDF